MLRLLPTVAALALTAALAAQGRNEVGYDVGATDFTSRSGIPGASDGDVLLRVEDTTLVGIGNNDDRAIHDLRFVLQDQDLATRDRFSVVVYPDDGTGAPTPAAETRSGRFALAAGNPGPAAFVVTLAFTSPLRLPSGSFHFGVGLSANAAWTTDGLSIHGGNYAQTPQVTNPNAPGLTSCVDTTAGQLAFRDLRRLHRISMRTESAVLEAGADVVGFGPLFGLRGYWSDRTADDGLVFRIRDAASANRPFAILGALGGATPGLRLTGIEGAVFLDPALLFPITLARGTLDAAGAVDVRVFPAPFTLPAPFGRFTAQALVDPLGSARMTNAAILQDR